MEFEMGRASFPAKELVVFVQVPKARKKTARKTECGE